MLLLWVLIVVCVSCLSCCRVYSLLSCGYLLGKGRPLCSLVGDYFVAFLYGVLDQVCYLIVSIPDLCRLPDFDSLRELSANSCSLLAMTLTSQIPLFINPKHLRLELLRPMV